MIKVPLHPYYPTLENYFYENILKLSPDQVKDRRLHSGNRYYGEVKKFEDWLFSEGIIIVQENKRKYLQFLNEQQAIMFTLKWGSRDV